MESIQIRAMELSDNVALAKIIRDALTEFGADQPGTVYYDESTDHLFELFQQDYCSYFVAEENGELLGGGGIFATAGLPEKTCELVKMYLKPAARGKRIGKLIIDHCLERAAEFGYENVYLETMPELEQAISVYEKFGFKNLTGPMGNSGHFGCSKWMLKSLAL